MSTNGPLNFNEDAWEDLLAGIEEQRVIPIVGPELLRYPDGLSAGQRIATALAGKLRIACSEMPAGFDIKDVVDAHLRLRGRREDLYARIKVVVRELALTPPPALQNLAAITDFGCFISLTFDTLLVQAIDEARCSGLPRTLHLGFAPNKPQDLPAERARLDTPVVYALLGKLSSMPEYAISDEDTLEFLCALQSEARRPPLLFDEMQTNHLLLLGCSFPDWLARFFIRIAKSRQLSAQRAEVETIVETRIAGEKSLALFLERFSYGTRVCPGDPVDFAAELAQRWQARRTLHGPSSKALSTPATDADAGAVFISYASEDVDAARRLSLSLRGQGIDVWFDKLSLGAGDLYDQLIRRRIKLCALFVPLVSANSQRRAEGFFRREWRLAEERSQGIADDVPFILPVAIDDMDATSAAVPHAFRQAHWSRLPGGAADERFTSQIINLVRAHHKRQRGLA